MEKADNVWHLVHAKEIDDALGTSIDDLEDQQEKQEHINLFLELKISRTRGENLRLIRGIEEDNNKQLKSIQEKERIEILARGIDKKEIASIEETSDDLVGMYR